jgi:hypothetical protein
MSDSRVLLLKKRAARQAVARALKANKIERSTICQRCHNDALYVGKCEFHHFYSYDKVDHLRGYWLCKTCHTEEHQETEEKELFLIPKTSRVYRQYCGGDTRGFIN